MKLEKSSIPDLPSNIYVQVANSETKEHHSQWHSVSWKEKEESQEVFAQKPRLQMKFGVIKVSNLPRKISNGRFCEGAATNLKADMQALWLGSYSKDGEFLPQDDPWLDREQLNWYRDGWYHDMYTGDTETAQQTQVDELKHILKRPSSVWKYLRNPTLDILPVGRDTFLPLFCTVEGHSDAYTDAGSLPPGKWKLKVSIYSNELKPKEYIYELALRTWIEFDLKELPQRT